MSGAPDKRTDAAFQRFLGRVWRDEVLPKLTGPNAQLRAKSARAGGALAGMSGRLLDSLFGLRGRPFSRALTVLGSSAGALLPDLFEWDWLRRATAAQREVLENAAANRAGELAKLEALDLFGLPPAATFEQVRAAWRDASFRWHPDKAANDDQRREHHLRFVAYQQAYERLRQTFEAERPSASA